MRDNGAGMRADVLAHVFDPFVQGDRSYNRSQGGLGIGLTLARSIVALHGGSIEARSAGLGQGSEFVVRLPLLQPDAAAPSVEPSAASRRASPASAFSSSTTTSTPPRAWARCCAAWAPT